ncbi:MAG: T9SS type A sorting domain-containing protein, partial [Bacteroidota bacterium]
TATMSIVVNPTYSTTATASICYGDTFNFGTQDLTAPGVYTELFQAITGCDSTVTLTLDVDSIDPGLSFTSPSCNADCDGVASSAPTGGTAPYTFLWYNGATTSLVTGLCAGDYSLTVTDASGCTMTGTVTVTEPAVLTVSVSPKDVSCFGGSNGEMTANVSGGTAPYTYLWSNNGTTQTITGLIPGTYSLVVTDANGCTATGSAGIAEPPDWTGQWDSVFNVTCNGGADGAIYATVGGATPPYTFSWSNGATTLDITGLAAGGYTLTITDANGCSTVEDTSVSQPPAIVITIDSTTSASSCATGNGAIYTSASGGTGPLTYMWSPGNGTGDDTVGVAAGTYTLTVTDSLGCAVSSTATVSSTSAIIITLDSVFNTSCNGDSDGEIYTSATGGTGTLTYMWSPGSGTSDDTVGVAAGNYVLTVTDANGCTATFTATVTEPAVLTVSVSATNPSCSALCDGSATANPTGGTGPFTYTWSPSGATTQTTTGLCAGTYTVCVTDANGCSACTTVTLTNPGTLTASVSITNVSCNGGNDGTATVNASGGSPAYTYAWSTTPVQTTQTATGLTAGTYTVVVTDACSQTVTATANITQPAMGIQVTTSEFPENPCGAGNGQAFSFVIGGTPPYTYLWNPTGQTTQNATGLSAGSYTVTVTDAAGCSIVSTVTVTCNPVGIAENKNVLNATLYPNPNSGEFTIEFVAVSADNYHVEISNGLGQVIVSEEKKNFSGNYAKKFDIRNYGTGAYFVSIRNSKGAIFRKLIIQ